MKFWQQYAYLALGWVCLWMLVACSDQEVEPSGTYVFTPPAHFPAPAYTFENNPVTEPGFELGKKLFYDPSLSRDGSVSCNNCHIQGTAFADAQQHPLSVGVDEQRGTRNAPSLANLAFMDEFFWDGGVAHLDFAPVNAIESDFEMDETLAHVVEKLNENETYLALFKHAFGVDKITAPYMLQALSQFLVMMVSDNSRYDQYIRKEATLNQQELEGMALFEQKCADCHAGVLFSDFSYQNNGLNASFTDEGRARITEFAGDIGKFKVPSLRNVALTAPYMHNARFQTLQEVLDHYDTGVVDSPTLAPLLKKAGQPLGISLSEDEKQKIIAFLLTLTDKSFVADPKFMNP